MERQRTGRWTSTSRMVANFSRMARGVSPGARGRARFFKVTCRQYDRLLDLGVIDQDTRSNPFGSFVEKVDAVEDQDERLRRFWTGRTFFEFPYDRSDSEGIDSVYSDFMDTIGQRKRKNRTMKALELTIAAVREGKVPDEFETDSLPGVFDEVLEQYE